MTPTMTDRIAEIAGLVARRREIDASLTPDGMHSSDWYQRRRDELLWTNARLADTVPELLDALADAGAKQAAAVAGLKPFVKLWEDYLADEEFYERGISREEVYTFEFWLEQHGHPRISVNDIYMRAAALYEQATGDTEAEA